MNMNGGGGAEIWQFTSRKSMPPPKPVRWGDLGINAVKIKTNDVIKSHQRLLAKGKSAVNKTPDNQDTYLISDAHHNQYQVVTDNSWFKSNKYMQGGVCGAVIGVSNMEQSVQFYKQAFKLQQVVFDEQGCFTDLGEPYLNQNFRRVLLKLENDFKAPFSKLLGNIYIELIQALDYEPVKIFANRYWGDLGFIHLCFDVPNMNALKSEIEKQGYKFTVDSAQTFDMGDSGGRFSYIEDPDGTLIEMVETHKVPVFKKWGIFLNLKNRRKQKPLPNWMVGLLGLNKVKE
jgi:catechol 2,3-dioxygenase-like lactoylglutathione lyase family enzyme